MGPSICRVEDENKRVCGEPSFTGANEYCETHYSYRYPASYERLKREIRCPECNGSRYDCGFCFGRGWMDPKRAIAYATPEPAPRTVAVPEEAAKKFFDPAPPAEKLNVDEDGVIQEPVDRSAEGLGF